MTELTAFGYRSGSSVLHGLDVRFKLVFLVMISLVSLKAQAFELAVLTCTLFVLMINAGVIAKSIVGLLRYVFFLLMLVFIARALSTSGSPIFTFKAISVTREGIYVGSIICWRLVLVIMIGLSMVATTRASEIRAAVEWFLRPFPFIPEKRVSIMMSLIMRFIPVIFDQAKITVDAQRARGIENRKNPAYRLKKLALPLMRRTFERADKLANAMEARCYTENRTDPELSSSRRDWIALFLAIGLCLIVLAID